MIEAGDNRPMLEGLRVVDMTSVVFGPYCTQILADFGAGALIALELKSGTEVWRFETGAPITASPAVAAGRLVIGATDGVLYCFGQKAIRQ